MLLKCFISDTTKRLDVQVNCLWFFVTINFLPENLIASYLPLLHLAISYPHSGWSDKKNSVLVINVNTCCTVSRVYYHEQTIIPVTNFHIIDTSLLSLRWHKYVWTSQLPPPRPHEGPQSLTSKQPPSLIFWLMILELGVTSTYGVCGGQRELMRPLTWKSHPREYKNLISLILFDLSSTYI